MTLLHPCHACQMGDHDNHHKEIETPPPGVMGGVSCPCEGECKDGRYCPRDCPNILKSIKARNAR